MSKFRVGVVGPFSGPRSCKGELLSNVLRDSEYAKYFDFVYKDDRSNPKTSALVALELVDSEVQGVIGHFNSTCAEAAIRSYPTRLPIILPASSAPHLSKHPNVYRMCPTDLQQAQLIIKTVEELVHRDCYVWTDQSPYALSIYAQLADYNLRPLDLEQKLLDQDLVVFLGAHSNIARAVKKLKYEGIISVVCSDDCCCDEFKTLTSGLPNIRKYVIQSSPGIVSCISSAVRTLYILLSAAHKTTLIPKENQTAKFTLLQL